MTSFWHRIQSLAYGTPSRAAVMPYVITAAVTIGIGCILPLMGLGGTGGALAFVAIMTCAWFNGIGHALMAPLLLIITSRLLVNGFNNPFLLSSKDVLDILVITVYTVSVSGAGQSRRRAQAIAEKRAQELIDQDRRKDEFLATLAHELLPKLFELFVQGEDILTRSPEVPGRRFRPALG